MNKFVWSLVGFLGGSYGTYQAIRHDILSTEAGSYFGCVKGVAKNAFDKIVHRRSADSSRAEACAECLSDKIHKSGYVLHKEKEAYDASKVVISNDLDISNKEVEEIDYEEYMTSSELAHVPELTIMYDMSSNEYYWRSNMSSVEAPSYWIGDYAEKLDKAFNGLASWPWVKTESGPWYIRFVNNLHGIRVTLEIWEKISS